MRGRSLELQSVRRLTKREKPLARTPSKSTSKPSGTATEAREPDSASQNPVIDGLQRELEPVLSDLSRVQREQVLTRVTQVVMAEAYSGPMPHPRHFREFEMTLPGSAERLLAMAEKSLDHNISIKASALKGDQNYRTLGMIFGFLALAIMICGALYAGMNDNNVLAGLLLGASVVGTVVAFINGQKKE